ncbi:hypothetical protein PIB30_072095 [Stylosanthes scabra]|uniref:Uncharacterized protein n=1 Tax=Stylosanthes scabra TaxID=79078 RepID=A0ABU6WMC7_9FABA|nr:hypothetical protein [Stylosanthes scabra]
MTTFFVFQEIDSKAAEEQNKSQGNRKTLNQGISSAAAVKRPPQPRKKAKNVEQENDNSSMEIENHVVAAKPRGRPKKAPAKVVDEDEILSLQERLAAYNFGASSDQSSSAAMEAEVPKENSRRGGAKKKLSSTIVLDSDSDKQNNVEDDEDEDRDFEILQPAAMEAGKKKAGRKPAGQKASTKRNVGSKQSQKLKTVEETSPEKKVRRLRPSPFNKKSGSLLGRLTKKYQNGSEDLSGLGSANSSPSSSTEEVIEVATVAARDRPQRTNRTKARYVSCSGTTEAFCTIMENILPMLRHDAL